MKSLKPDAVHGMHAGMTIPTRLEPVLVGDDLCMDGAAAFGFPARHVIETFGPTDLLIWANRTELEWWRQFEDGVTSLSMRRRYSVPLRKAFAARHKQARAELRYLRSQTRCRYLIVWTDTNTGTFECNRVKLSRALVHSRQKFSALLAWAKVAVDTNTLLPLAAE